MKIAPTNPTPPPRTAPPPHHALPAPPPTPRQPRATAARAPRPDERDTPRCPCGYRPAGGEQSRRRGRERPDLRGPGVGGGGGQRPGRDRPLSPQRGGCRHAAVGDHLTEVALPARAAGELGEHTPRNEKGEEQNQ